MKIKNLVMICLIFVALGTERLTAQTSDRTENIASTSDNLSAQPFTDRSLFYSVLDSGISKPIIWGLDLAWLDEINVRRGVSFMGKERVNIVRSSFMPTNTLVGDTALQGDALVNTNKRIQIIKKWLSDSITVMLNDDNPSVNPYFYGNAANWVKLIEATAKLHQNNGLNVVSVAPFNEPDNTGAGQGTVDDFYNICVELRKNPFFDTIRISGPNTLNTDVFFYPWYNVLKEKLDEGNTHLLAGNFDNYALIFETVRANGQHATNDELHNVMEAMVGVEYGLQTGIWWGTAELARGEFVKASDGRRLGYAEHRENWTAASVYRAPNDKVQAFIGGSERQAATTTYRFVSKDRDVFYGGNGPQREFVLELPGGAAGSYQNGQTNAEKVVNITWGDDIQPVVEGKYIMVNQNSGKVMEAANGSTVNGTNIQQNASNGATYQQWNVKPINPRNGGDFSYFTITGVASGKHLDITNASLDNGGNLIMYEKGTWWDGRQSLNQVWYLEYAEDGWFYIRNQFSAKCLEVANNSNSNGANIQQWDKDGGTNQQWRFIPVGTTVDFDAPSAPVNLVAIANAESVRLDWFANSEEDVESYTIFRAESEGGKYNTIARNVKTTAFVDNTCTEVGQYFYKIKAVDQSLNSSVPSEVAEANTTGEHDLVAHYLFNGNTLDSSINLNHGATLGEITYVNGKVDNQAIALNGDNAFIQLPATLANQQEITIATWVYCNERSSIKRIFEFRNNDNEYMYLTPRMRFAIKNGGSEQRLDAATLPVGEWVHVAITLGSSGAHMYKNGELVDESTDISIRPIDFRPILNYIGRGQLPTLLFNGDIDDFRIYNYELSPEEIAKLVSDVNTGLRDFAKRNEIRFNVYPNPANDLLKFIFNTQNETDETTLRFCNIYGELLFKQEIRNIDEGEINVSGIPAGIYIIKITNGGAFLTRKIMVQH